MRLERIERLLERNTEMLGELGNRADRAAEKAAFLEGRFDRHDRYHNEVRDALERDMDKIDRRLRGLDFRFYGVLAGLVAAAGYVIINGGPPTP